MRKGKVLDAVHEDRPRFLRVFLPTVENLRERLDRAKRFARARRAGSQADHDLRIKRFMPLACWIAQTALSAPNTMPSPVGIPDSAARAMTPAGIALQSLCAVATNAATISATPVK